MTESDFEKRLTFAKRCSRNEAIEHCKQMVQEYFINYIDRIPDDLDLKYVKTLILTPSREIVEMLEDIKS